MCNTLVCKRKCNKLVTSQLLASVYQVWVSTNRWQQYKKSMLSQRQELSKFPTEVSTNLNLFPTNCTQDINHTFKSFHCTISYMCCLSLAISRESFLTQLVGNKYKSKCLLHRICIILGFRVVLLYFASMQV